MAFARSTVPRLVRAEIAGTSGRGKAPSGRKFASRWASCCRAYSNVASSLRCLCVAVARLMSRKVVKPRVGPAHRERQAGHHHAGTAPRRQAVRGKGRLEAGDHASSDPRIGVQSPHRQVLADLDGDPDLAEGGPLKRQSKDQRPATPADPKDRWASNMGPGREPMAGAQAAGGWAALAIDSLRSLRRVSPTQRFRDGQP
jgi:hypothetical protein